MPQQSDNQTSILFIDDSASDRTTWRHELTRCSSDYTIVEAWDMQSGMDLYRSQRFDCVVLEIGLPNEEGFKTLPRLIPLVSRPHIAVIVLTRIATRGVLELSRRNGAYACLAKQHATGENLHRAIQRAIALVGQLPKEDRHRYPSI